jgi:hypothetical protein
MKQLLRIFPPPSSFSLRFDLSPLSCSQNVHPMFEDGTSTVRKTLTVWLSCSESHTVWLCLFSSLKMFKMCALFLGHPVQHVGIRELPSLHFALRTIIHVDVLSVYILGPMPYFEETYIRGRLAFVIHVGCYHVWEYSLQSFKACIPWKVAESGDASDLGGARFEYWPGFRLSWRWRILVISQIPEYCLTTPQSHPSTSFPVHYSLTSCHSTSAAK